MSIFNDEISANKESTINVVNFYQHLPKPAYFNFVIFAISLGIVPLILFFPSKILKTVEFGSIFKCVWKTLAIHCIVNNSFDIKRHYKFNFSPISSVANRLRDPSEVGMAP